MRIAPPQALKSYLQKRRHHALLNLVRIPSSGTVLDLSCGKGEILHKIGVTQPSLKLSGIDIDAGVIEQAKVLNPNATFSVGDASKLPFESKAVNLVISSMSVHHYRNLETIFSEVARILTEDGSFYVMDVAPRYRLTLRFWNFWGCSEAYHFERYYRRSDLEVLLEKRGLSIKEETRIDRFPRICVYRISLAQ